MRKKILLIEDEKDFIAAVSILLKSEGYDVLLATDGMEGLRKAKASPVDLIILDIMMPKMDGYKVCRMLKFDKKHKETPILMLTAKAREADRRMGEQCGADAYLLKSQSPDMLLSKVKELLKK